MKVWKCLACEYEFYSENDIPYCPCCENEKLKVIQEEEPNILEVVQDEEHHIHPRFMGNKNGLGQKYRISKKQHDILHGLIMKWIWDEIPTELQGRIAEVVVKKSKNFIGVDDE